MLTFCSAMRPTLSPTLGVNGITSTSWVPCSPLSSSPPTLSSIPSTVVEVADDEERAARPFPTWNTHTHTKITQLHCKYLKSIFYANLIYTIFNGPYKAKFHYKKWFKLQTKYALHLCVYHTLKTLTNSVTWFPLICRIHSHFLSVYSEHIR